MSQRSGPADLAPIETDTAERAESDPAADSVLVGNLDSESFAAGRTPRAIKVQQRAEHDVHPKDAHRDRRVAVRGAGVARHGEDCHARRRNEAADSQGFARTPRPSFEVFPDRHACHAAACYRAHPATGAEGGLVVTEVYRTTERLGIGRLSCAGAGRVRGPKRPGNRAVWPIALYLRIQADSAARTRANFRPGNQFAGAARASGACQWNVQKRPNHRPEEPEIEQKRPEHPKTLERAQRMLGIEADKYSGHDNHQEPPQAPSNIQLQ